MPKQSVSGQTLSAALAADEVIDLDFGSGILGDGVISGFVDVSGEQHYNTLTIPEGNALASIAGEPLTVRVRKNATVIGWLHADGRGYSGGDGQQGSPYRDRIEAPPASGTEGLFGGTSAGGGGGGGGAGATGGLAEDGQPGARGGRRKAWGDDSGDGAGGSGGVGDSGGGLDGSAGANATALPDTDRAFITKTGRFGARHRFLGGAGGSGGGSGGNGFDNQNQASTPSGAAGLGGVGAGSNLGHGEDGGDGITTGSDYGAPGGGGGGAGGGGLDLYVGGDLVVAATGRISANGGDGGNGGGPGVTVGVGGAGAGSPGAGGRLLVIHGGTLTNDGTIEARAGLAGVGGAGAPAGGGAASGGAGEASGTSETGYLVILEV